MNRISAEVGKTETERLKLLEPVAVASVISPHLLLFFARAFCDTHILDEWLYSENGVKVTDKLFYPHSGLYVHSSPGFKFPLLNDKYS